MPDDYSSLTGPDDELEGYDPTDPFSALSSRNAIALAGAPPTGTMPQMPAQQRAAQLAQDPNLTKVVQPSAWRMGLGLAAQWLSPRRVGPAVNQLLTATDPQVRAHQELLNKYGIAEQQAQQERQGMGVYGNLALKQELAKGRQANQISQAQNRQLGRGWQQSPATNPAPPIAPDLPPSVTMLTPPPLETPVNPGELPKVAPPGSIAEPLAGTNKQGYIPPRAAQLEAEETAKEKAKAAVRAGTLPDEVLSAVGRMDLSGQQIDPATKKQINDQYGKLLTHKTERNVPPENQFIEEYRKLNPGATVADALTAFKKIQPPEKPEKPPQALMIGPDNTAILVRPGTQVPAGAQTTAGVNAVNTPTMQMRNVAAQAQLVHEQTPQMLSEIDRLKDKLGPVAGRWNEFMQGRVGLNDPDMAGLRTDLLMYSSAVALMHARGRLPENLREEFDRAINAPRQDYANLKAVISHIDNWTTKNIEAMGGRGAATQGGGANNIQKKPLSEIFK